MNRLLSVMPEDTNFFCDEEQLCDRIFELGLDAKITLALVQNILANQKKYWDSSDIRNFMAALYS